MALVLFHGQFDHGESGVMVKKGFRVLVQELVGGNVQSILHSKDIVGRQEQLKSGATFGEARNTRVAFKLKGGFVTERLEDIGFFMRDHGLFTRFL
jgi:hypothetical protein